MRDGIVVRILVSPDPSLTLGNVVDRLGPPEYLRSVMARGPDGATAFIDVYYPSCGLRLELDRPSLENAGYLAPNVGVDAAYYSEPGDLLDYLVSLSMASCFRCRCEREHMVEAAKVEMSNAIQRWPGWGEIENAFVGPGPNEWEPVSHPVGSPDP